MRSPVTVSLNAVGVSPWIPLDAINAWYGVGLQLVPSSNIAGLTATVQHTFDSFALPGQRPITFSQTTTTVTVTDPGAANTPGGGNGHGLSIGDSVVIQGTTAYLLGQLLLSIDGTYAVATVPSQTTYTFTVPAGLSQTSAGPGLVNALRVNPNSSIGTNNGTRVDANYAYPVRGIRLSVTAITGGYVDLVVNQGVAL